MTEGSRQGLIAAVGAATQAFQRSTDAFDDAVATRLGLNRADLRCLDWLYDGPKTVGQIGAGTGLSSAATTALVDRLERRKLVRRAPDPADRRRVLCEMTELGRRRTEEFYGPVAVEGAELLERFDDGVLRAFREHLVAAAELIDRHRARLREAPVVTPEER